MSKFKKKAKVNTGSGSSISNEQWKEWNEYVYDRIMEGTEDGDEPTQPCFISGICDPGLQSPQEAEREYDWEDTEQQNKLIKVGVGRVEGDKFYVKNRDNDTVVMTVDFPSILIDYSKHPASDSDEEDFKPYRELLAGDWEGAASPIALNPSKDGYNPKSRIATLCKVTGVKKGKVPEDFDLGELLGAEFMMSIEANWSEDEKFMNVKISSPANKPKAIPMPEHDIEPFAVMMDGDNDEEDLKQINSKILKRLQLAKEWDDSGLKKELERVGRLGGGSSDDSEEEKPKKNVTKPKRPSKVEQEPDEEPEGDDNPFDLGDDD